MEIEEDILTAPAFAELAGVDRRTVVNWCAAGLVAAWRYGKRGRWYIRRSELERLKRDNSQASTTLEKIPR